MTRTRLPFHASLVVLFAGCALTGLGCGGSSSRGSGAPLPPQAPPTAAPTPAATPAPTPAATPAPTPAATPAPTPAATPAPSPSATPAPSPSATPAPSPAPMPPPMPKPLKISWTPPTENVNGQPLSAPLAGYTLYYGPDPQMYVDTVEINDPAATDYTDNGAIPPGLWYFALTARDTAGQESDFSNEVSKVVQ